MSPHASWPPCAAGRYCANAGKPDAAVGMSRDPRQPEPRPRSHARIGVSAAEPQRVGRHRQGHVLVQERRQRVHVVALERRHVAVEQLCLGVGE